jgi:two-component system chemotaxis sensor kinase CheA/two-component system sensor histidine kinase and response regulator WspE
MSDRRDAIVGRFRAGTLERLRRVAAALIAFEEGRGTRAEVQSVARELHTIKGESRMLGFALMSEVVHGAESLLLAIAPGEQLPSAEAAATVGAALDRLGRWLRGELGAAAAADAVLAQTKEALGHAVAAATTPAPAGETPRGVAAPGGPAAVAAPVAAPLAERWVQVSAAKIDELNDRLTQFSADFRALDARLRHLAGGASDTRALVEDFDRCRAQLEDVTSASWALRLVPVEPVLGELLRHARELATAQGKRLRVVVEAARAQVERSVLDELWEGLLHLTRNAIDHGIEPPPERAPKPVEASLTLRAEPVGSNVVFTISDDGRGVDPALVRAAAVKRGRLRPAEAETLSDDDTLELLFEHGFSTRAEVGEISGRGVGLDVVRAVVEGLGGAVSLRSTPGQGTSITMSIPTSLSIERALVVECGGALYGFPARYVQEVLRTREHVVEPVVGGQMLRYRELALPLRSLSTVLSRPAEDEPWALIISAGDRRWALTVPSLLGEHELVRQPIDRLLGALEHLGASATLDDGRLVLIVAMAGLLRRAERRTTVPAVAPKAVRKPRALVVDDSAVIRDLVVQILRASGLEVVTAPEGRAALALVDAEAPDVVISDIEMPGMNGFELLKAIRARSQKLPVIMLTSRGSMEDRQRAAALGANAHLTKSGFEEDTLVEIIRRFVELPRA